MESLKLDNFIEILRSKNITLFTYLDLHQLFPSISQSGLSAAIKRLIKTKTIHRIEQVEYDRSKLNQIINQYDPDQFKQDLNQFLPKNYRQLYPQIIKETISLLNTPT
jgi:hypothetical protein